MNDDASSSKVVYGFGSGSLMKTIAKGPHPTEDQPNEAQVARAESEDEDSGFEEDAKEEEGEIWPKKPSHMENGKVLDKEWSPEVANETCGRKQNLDIGKLRLHLRALRHQSEVYQVCTTFFTATMKDFTNTTMFPPYKDKVTLQLIKNCFGSDKTSYKESWGGLYWVSHGAT